MKFFTLKIDTKKNNRYDCISPMSTFSYFSPVNRYTKFKKKYDNRIPYPIKIVNIKFNINKLKINRDIG